MSKLAFLTAIVLNTLSPDQAIKTIDAEIKKREKVAEKSHTDHYILGLLYKEKAKFLSKDPAQYDTHYTLRVEYHAKEHFITAKGKGHILALYEIGKNCEKSIYQDDQRQAVFWYGLAAEKGVKKAYYRLGRLSSDSKKEAAYYRKAAALGHEESKRRLNYLKDNPPEKLFDRLKDDKLDAYDRYRLQQYIRSEWEKLFEER